MIIGIDPGCSGAIVAVTEEFKLEGYILMPTIKIGNKNRVNGAAISSFLRQYDLTECHVYIEQVGAMPKQGVSSMFTFGHACGVVVGVVEALFIPYTLVTPQAWKKKAGLIGQDKDAARSRAIQLYPGLPILNQIAKGQAIADALLIARFGSKEQFRKSLL